MTTLARKPIFLGVMLVRGDPSFLVLRIQGSRIKATKKENQGNKKKKKAKAKKKPKIISDEEHTLLINTAFILRDYMSKDFFDNDSSNYDDDVLEDETIQCCMVSCAYTWGKFGRHPRKRHSTGG